jgi:dienelactone hydrolase
MGRGSFRVLTFLAGISTFGVSGWSAERVVDLTAADGVKLKATYFAAGKPGPGVLLLHQCNRQRKIWDGLAQQLAAAGINVLTLDYRGFGESDGDRFDKLPPQQAAQTQAEKWPGDIDTAFQYLVSQPGVTRDVIGAGGASCGVNNSIQTARRHTEVKSLVLLSGNTDLKGRQFLRESTKLPVFFAVADDDEYPTSIVAIEWLYSLDADPHKKFLHVATGGHGADMFKVHPDMPGEIVNWYVTTLIKTPGRAPGAREKVAVPKEVHVLNQIDEPGGAAKIAKNLEEARQHDPKAKLFPEDIVNFMGYEHLQAQDNKGAIEILKLNAEGYPNSPNVYDSLADAYFADGQRDLVRENAKKALQLLDSDTTDPEDRRKGIKDSAEQKLKQLGEAPQNQ